MITGRNQPAAFSTYCTVMYFFAAANDCIRKIDFDPSCQVKILMKYRCSIDAPYIVAPKGHFSVMLPVFRNVMISLSVL
jgi:hypothetical protein